MGIAVQVPVVMPEGGGFDVADVGELSSLLPRKGSALWAETASEQARGPPSNGLHQSHVGRRHHLGRWEREGLGPVTHWGSAERTMFEARDTQT